MFRKVKSLFSRQKQTFSKHLSLLQLYWNGISLMLIFVTRFLVMFLWIRLGLNHLADHIFRHNFQDCINHICSCGQVIETSTHFLLHCSNYHSARQTLFEKVKKIDSSILKQNDQVIAKTLLFVDEKLKAAQNISLLTSAIEFLQATERFKTSLFN